MVKRKGPVRYAEGMTGSDWQPESDRRPLPQPDPEHVRSTEMNSFRAARDLSHPVGMSKER